ncbi:iron only hydrogenase large subunit-like protein [Anaerosolibacter carboniphilus]|uniref:Iron only hydrogenase large subunit-like protein n=1 Tax=Anaerosolibacter carboniphilus TaxID=1417629 RepID=A0A841L4B0_9FIRM|nr:[Fe-Fe] hydrogenase large subunit C-terminal domain-containing protein [Anaerosolibacter carboniphilus]MBB6219000.1 iron only hydrogenase large subunit-like protein [Anaerosolibacter carboniphilus]
MENTTDNQLQRYRMSIFKEVAKLAWQGKLEEGIEDLPDRILGEDIQDEKERKIVRNYIRMAMGVDPTYEDHHLKEDVEKALHLSKVESPLVAVIQNICEECHRYHGDDIYDEDCPRGYLDCTKAEHKCLGCGKCIGECPLGAISDKIEFIPIIKMLQEKKQPIYATIAPAYIGQLGEHMTPGKMRSALKWMGFTDMIEVAVFADILTVKEAYEFDHMVKTEKDFFITSCCCPVWVGLIQKNFKDIEDHVSPSVSPMIASGRVLKALNPDAKVVFIGPCIAKKAEAKIEELKDAIDYVLTFRELHEIFGALEIDLDALEEDHREEASFAGRVYARTGGVSKAVELSVNRVVQRKIPFKSICFDGAKDCKDGLKRLIEGEIEANFIEGMGCVGGCVGGPRTIASIEEATEKVNRYSESTPMKTPFDNNNVLQLITSLGLKRLESLEDEESIKNLLVRNLNES